MRNLINGKSANNIKAALVANSRPLATAALLALVVSVGGAAQAQVVVPTPPDFAPTITAVQAYSNTLIGTYFPGLVLIAVTFGGMRFVYGKIRSAFGH